MKSLKRASAILDKKHSMAILSIQKRDVVLTVELQNDGLITIDIKRKNKETIHRVLSPQVNYND